MARLVISGALVVDTSAAATTPKRGTLIVEDGRVVAHVAAHEAVDGHILDASGLYAIPGLIDLHFPVYRVGFSALQAPHERSVARNVHEALQTLSCWLDRGVTSARVPGAHGNLDIQLRDVVNGGSVRGPRLFAAGRPIAGARTRAGGDPTLAWEVAGPDEARRAARLAIKSWADQLQVFANGLLGEGRWVDMPGFPPLDEDELRAVVDEARHASVPVFAHAGSADAVRKCLMAGVNVVEHAPALNDEALALLSQGSAHYLPALASARAWSVPDDGCCDCDSVITNAKQQWDEGRMALRRAVEAGVQVVCGSCAGDRNMSLWDECELLAEMGWSPYQALRAATSVAAQALGQDRDLGTLQPGCWADVVLLAGNPLEDITNLRLVEIVIKEGKVVFDRKEANGRAESND